MPSVFQPGDVSIDPNLRIDHIANDPVRVKVEIAALRDRERKLKRDLWRKEMEKELDSNGYQCPANNSSAHIDQSS
jgi:hypothetical protein